MPNLRSALTRAEEITKEYVRGGGAKSPDYVLEEVYQKIVALEKEIENSGQ